MTAEYQSPLAHRPVHRRLMSDGTFLASIAIVAVLVLALFGPNMSMKAEGASGEGSPLRQFLYLLTFGVAVSSTRPLRTPTRLLVLPTSMVIVLLWCWLSLSWSMFPSIAFRRLALTTILIWTIFISVRCAGYQRTIFLFRMVMLAILVGNILTVAFLPSIGIHQAATSDDPGLIGAWRGLLLQKNFAGAASAVTILVFLFDIRNIPSLLRWAAVILALVFLIGTESKTSMGICVVSIFVGWLFGRYNPAYRLLFIPVILIVGAIFFFLIETRLDSVLTHLAQDRQAFTGRVEIWIPLIEYAKDHPWTGSGYGSFWNIGNAREPIHTYAKGWVTGQTSGHNGFLDAVVQVGLPGLVLALMAYLLIPIARLVVSQTITRSTASLLFALVIFCISHNATESSIIERDISVHVFLLFAIALIYVLTVATPEQRQK